MLIETLTRGFQQLSFLRDGAAIVRNPYDLKAVLSLSGNAIGLATPEDVRQLAEEICRDPLGLAAVESRLRVNADPAPLRKLPAGTLGRAYADHLDRNHITPESLKPPGEVTDDFSYVIARLYETHDIWHALTGFGTSVAHELGLAAFGAAQTSSKFQYLLLAGGLLNTTFYEYGDRDARMSAIARGWRMGRKAKPVFGVRWEELWAEPLDKVRAELGIARPVRAKKRSGKAA